MSAATADSLGPEAVTPLFGGHFGTPYLFEPECESTQLLLLGSDLAAITSRSQRVANRRFKESADWAPRVANAREGLRLLTG